MIEALMRKIQLLLNNRTMETDLPAGTPALDLIRAEGGLTGTKEGCREGDCGACLVLVGACQDGAVTYHPANSCLLALGSLRGKQVVTVEGLNQPALTPIQQLIVDEGATQCGFCTPGFVVALTGFFLCSPDLSEADAMMAIEGNLCRCTGYASLRRAIARLCDEVVPRISGRSDRVEALVQERILPAWFTEVPGLLSKLEAPEQPAPAAGQTVLGGGTDLLVQQSLAGTEVWPVAGAGLDRIWCEDGDLYVGAGASTEAIRTSPEVAELIEDAASRLRLVSSWPIRHQATLGGNLVNASPIADLAILFLALDATIGLAKGKSRRTMLLRSFFKGYKQLDLDDGEVVEWLRVPGRLRGTRFSFEKVSKRTYLDIASVCSAAAIRIEGERIVEAHLAAGGVAPVPLYLAQASQALTGQTIGPEAVRQAVAAADQEIAPISDIRGSAEYKRLLLRQLIYAHCNRLLDLQEGLP
jgi:xanthine dehydrogenase small subunit